MAAITAALIGATVAVGSAVNANKQAKKQASAAKKAAAGQQQTAIESAKFIQEQGLKGELEIREAAIKAAETASNIPSYAGQPLERLNYLGGRAFQNAAGDIMSGQPSSQSGLSQNIASSFVGGANTVPYGRGQSNAVNRELQRQGALSGELAGRISGQGQFDLGRQGLLTAGDLAQMDIRGANRLGDIATNQAAGRASSLVGSAAPAASAIQGASDAALLSQYAGNQYQTQRAENLARLGGQLYGDFK